MKSRYAIIRLMSRLQLVELIADLQGFVKHHYCVSKRLMIQLQKLNQLNLMA